MIQDRLLLSKCFIFSDEVSQEFERLAFQYGLTVKVIPLSEHHEFYSAEDIELWEVSRINLRSVSPTNYEGLLRVWNWGNIPTVKVTLSGVDALFVQSPGGVVGAVLWPAAVVVARYGLCLIFLSIFKYSGQVSPIKFF
jgi:hypothetical protein